MPYFNLTYAIFLIVLKDLKLQMTTLFEKLMTKKKKVV